VTWRRIRQRNEQRRQALLLQQQQQQQQQQPTDEEVRQRPVLETTNSTRPTSGAMSDFNQKLEL
jgi:hypothetical protein